MSSLQGHLLVASPKLVDPNFRRSVILMVQHGEDGAMGLVINRPSNTSLKKVWEQVGEESDCHHEGVLHHGGPCGGGPLMAVHADPTLSEFEVVPGVYFTTDKHAIMQLVGQDHCPMKFFVGYAGWAPGQLEGEMEEGAWLKTGAAGEHVFAAAGQDLWTTLSKSIQRQTAFPWLDPRFIPDDPSVN